MFSLRSAWWLTKCIKINSLHIWRIVYSLTGAYIILGTANLIVICWPFGNMTINGKKPLNIYLIVFFLFSPTTMELTSWDLSMCFFVEFISCSFEDISLDKVISAIAFYLPNILPGSWPIFRQWTMAMIILMICASRMRFGAD